MIPEMGVQMALDPSLLAARLTELYTPAQGSGRQERIGPSIPIQREYKLVYLKCGS